MEKNIMFWSSPGVHYRQLDSFVNLLSYFLDEFDGVSAFSDEVDLAKRLLSFVKSKETYFYA